MDTNIFSNVVIIGQRVHIYIDFQDWIKNPKEYLKYFTKEIDICSKSYNTEFGIVTQDDVDDNIMYNLEYNSLDKFNLFLDILHDITNIKFKNTEDWFQTIDDLYNKRLSLLNK